MRKDNKATHQLKELYETALEFRQAQPWKAFYDADNVTLNRLMDICLKNGVPKEIQVRSEAMEAILGDFCKKTGIKLKVIKRLAAIDQMMKEMAYRF